MIMRQRRSASTSRRRIRTPIGIRPRSWRVRQRRGRDRGLSQVGRPVDCSCRPPVPRGRGAGRWRSPWRPRCRQPGSIRSAPGTSQGPWDRRPGPMRWMPGCRRRWARRWSRGCGRLPSRARRHLAELQGARDALVKDRTAALNRGAADAPSAAEAPAQPAPGADRPSDQGIGHRDREADRQRRGAGASGRSVDVDAGRRPGHRRRAPGRHARIGPPSAACRARAARDACNPDSGCGGWRRRPPCGAVAAAWRVRRRMKPRPLPPAPTRT